MVTIHMSPFESANANIWRLGALKNDPAVSCSGCFVFVYLIAFCGLLVIIIKIISILTFTSARQQGYFQVGPPRLSLRQDLPKSYDPFGFDLFMIHFFPKDAVLGSSL